MPNVITKDKRQFKQTYNATGKLQPSMKAAGYSDNSSKMGMSALPQELQRWVNQKRARLDKKRALGSAINAEDQENIVRGHLLENVLSGKDNAVRSAEYLGKDKRVAMFTADTITAVQINISELAGIADLVSSKDD